MPLPVAHGLLGAVAVILISPRISLRRDWLMLLFGAFLAVSPDFDFFFVWILDWGEEWHRGFSHSIFTALLFTFLMFFITKVARFKAALACGAALLSHGLLDFTTTKLDKGVKLLSPVLDERFKLGLVDYLRATQHYSVMDYVKASLIELLVLAPIFLVILWIGGYLSHNDFRARRT